MLKKLWRGEYPLWLTFWVVAVGGTLLLQGFVYLIQFFYSSNSIQSVSFIYLILAVAPLYTVFLWIVTGRSSVNYKGRRLWPIMAKIVIALILFKSLTDIYLIYEYETIKDDFREQLVKKIQAKNKELPVKWGETLEWYKVAVEGNNMVFYYRFVNLNPLQQASLQISPVLVQKRLNEIFSGEAVCKSKDATLFFQHNMGLIYRVDRNGQQPYLVYVTAEQCKEKTD
ncbi:hypothetical protein [Legionella feeleii]|uniref:Uncharacterized protein n=1 Tax=Legionella feeleii TaxID=453 RepID=A0A0W0U5A5_9GAMM|nr:hypothetical protein [Legionella feeleii]KTD03096.1 hypothetical protein Lfee_0452 [Legionella feeleii]SPX61325.1 Uncharacterised protein [Legionella feeleii]